jgi:cell division protein FtsN
LKIALVIGLAAILAGLIAFLMVKGKEKSAPKKGHKYRFPRSLDQEPPILKPKKSLKPLLLWMVLVLLVAWVVLAAFSLKSDKGSDATASASAEVVENEPPSPLSSRISTKFESNPHIPTEEEMELLAQKEAEALAALEAEKDRAQKGEDYDEPQVQVVAEAGLGFAPIPEELVIIGSPMTQGAKNFAPKISRMEPIGRSLDPSVPAPPKKAKIEPGTQPPPKEELRLTAPEPRAPPAPIPLAKPLSERRYTVIVGSFSKEGNALQLLTKFQDVGLPAEITPVNVNNKTFFRVRSGVFDDLYAAESYCRDLRQRNLAAQPYIMVL